MIMPLNFVGDTVAADGAASVEDALILLEFLQSHPNTKVDLGSCTHLHTAVLQVLLAAMPQIVTPPREAFLARWLPQVLQRCPSAA